MAYRIGRLRNGLPSKVQVRWGAVRGATRASDSAAADETTTMPSSAAASSSEFGVHPGPADDIVNSTSPETLGDVFKSLGGTLEVGVHLS